MGVSDGRVRWVCPKTKCVVTINCVFTIIRNVGWECLHYKGCVRWVCQVGVYSLEISTAGLRDNCHHLICTLRSTVGMCGSWLHDNHMTITCRPHDSQVDRYMFGIEQCIYNRDWCLGFREREDRGGAVQTSETGSTALLNIRQNGGGQSVAVVVVFTIQQAPVTERSRC